MNKSIVDKTKKAALISFDSLKAVYVYDVKIRII